MAVNYGSKRTVVGAHYGLRDWLVQRGTGALMAVFTVVLLAQVLISKGSMGYDRWAGIFSVRQTTALILFLVLVSRLITLTLLGLVDTSPPASLHLLPVLASALVWPTVLLSLRRWTQR